MGYEVRLFFGRPIIFPGDEPPYLVPIDASVDLHESGSMEYMGLELPERPLYYVIGDDEKATDIVRDAYGSPLSFGAREAVLAALEQRLREVPACYRGVWLAVTMLRAMTPDLYPGLIVLGYGS